MQTQAGQHSQLGGVSFLNKGFGSLRKAWHSDDDGFTRREIRLQITKLIQKNGSGLENKVPGIINEVETALYLNAASKEEYGDLNTLELRIHALILRARNGQKSAQYGTQQGSNVSKLLSPSFSAPPPGFTAPSPGFSGQIPNSFSSLGTGGFLSSHGTRVVSNTTVPSGYDAGSIGPAGFNMYLRGPAIGQQASTPSGLFESGLENKGQFMSGIGNIPRMIPTPGLNIRSSEVPYNVGGMAFPNPMDNSIDKFKQQMLSTGRRGDSLASSNIMSPNGVLCDSSSKLSNAKVGLLRAPYQHHVNQQQLCSGITEGNTYPSEVGDIRNLYNSMTQVGSAQKNVGSSSLVEAPSNSIPGLFDGGQQGFHLSDSLQSFSRSQSNESLQSTLQQQQKQSGSLLVSNRCSELESGNNLFHADSSPPPPRTLLDENLLATFISQCQPGRSTPAAVAHGIHEPSCVEKGDQGVSRNSLDPPKVQHHCQLGGNVNRHEQSERACQANSADTGQSEVVSNDDGLAPSQVKEVGSSSLLQFMKRQQWLLILFWHVTRCVDSENCTIAPCKDGREAWEHITSCRTSLCPQPRCMHLKYLLSHHQKCRSSKCAICSPVRLHIRNQIMASRAKAKNRPLVDIVKDSACNEVESPPMKRVKVEVDASKAPQQPQQSISTVESQDQASCRDTLSTPNARNPSDCLISSMERAKGEISSVETNSSCESSVQAGLHEDSLIKASSVAITMLDSVHTEQDSVQQATGPLKPYTSQRMPAVALPQKAASPFEKTMKPKLSGLSYIESLSPQQIRQHISSLRKWTGQSKGKAERNQAMENHMSASACSACAVEALYFDPIPVFCTQCGCRIKRNATYYSAGSGENGLNFCGPCFNAIKSEVFETDGIKIQKSMLGKKKNDEQRVEGWVECDKCNKWQHQICVLFNARINKERSEYVCPECCIAEMERGQRVPWPSNSVLGAKDLLRTVLSDHVEDRLARRLEQERTERARALGMPVEEVPTAEGLVVRVISSVDKKLEVRPRFLELFQQENYPKDLLYKSKMLMLFQKIEGVEVCLFGMYVQEFGADCPQPNRRHVYLSYLDSVKYFRPDVKTTNGEALRTFVYHEILIAYLDYCKKRGFSSCYIWACPPLKGDDYILYCHPEIQKTPKTDKLRDWYLSMIAKSKKENIVVANKNLYDYFFTSNGESKAKVSAARLPYFDGDYWPGAAEDILQQLQQDEEGPNSQRRGRVTKLATKRTTKTSTHAELAGNVSRDMQLMHKLGQSIVGMKEDFMMVHLHHACSHCHEFIISGHRWFCQQCTANFQLCSGCHEEHKKLDEEERHPAGKKECHLLVMEEVEAAPASTVDKDEIMESELFDNRHAFLNLCQGNQYQYDTLRRAKHSSMMVLYHLHNPDAPAFIASCSVCHLEMEPAQGWKCKVCSDFDVCSSCYSSPEVQRHPHKLVARTTAADDSAKQRVEQLRAMLEVLAHASKCRDASCQYAKCRNIKSLFRHGNSCTKRAAGGCSLCKRMWFLLQCHARSCKDTICSVPRCMDLKKHFRRLQLQQESRRRAAVNEMMRQRVAEQTGSLS